MYLPHLIVMSVITDDDARLLQESEFLWGIDSFFNLIWFGFWLDYLLKISRFYYCLAPCIRDYHCLRVSKMYDGNVFIFIFIMKWCLSIINSPLELIICYLWCLFLQWLTKAQIRPRRLNPSFINAIKAYANWFLSSEKYTPKSSLLWEFHSAWSSVFKNNPISATESMQLNRFQTSAHIYLQLCLAISIALQRS